MPDMAPIGFELAAAAALLLINGVISWTFRLDLEKTLAIAALRMVVQLAAVGFLLKVVFEYASAPLTVTVACVMALVAAHGTLIRQGGPLRGPKAYGLGAGTLLIVGLLGSIYAAVAAIGAEPWYAPRTLLPILGLMLGNTLTGIGLVLDSLAHAAKRERAAIEARLALGASRIDAMHDVLRQALTAGMMPILNTMAVAGLATLPGLMAGQLLAGVDPAEAAKTQIMVMFVLAGGTALGVLLTALGGAWLLTDSRHRLRLDRLAG